MNQTAITFQRPQPFSASDFFMKSILPQVEDKRELTPFIICGKTDAVDDISQHWFLRDHLKERTSKKAIFLVEEEALHKYVPYLLLPYGKSIQIVEPISLKQKMIDVLYELINFYQVENFTDGECQ